MNLNKTLITIILTGALQLTAFSGLTVYLFQSSNSSAQEYALMAEANSLNSSRRLTEELYQRIQNDRNLDRDELHAWTLRMIELQIAKSKISAGRIQE